jgi:uncharacterized Zn finger protein (UPF0148 family)
MQFVSEINAFGDIRCPSCGLWIVAPIGAQYQSGILICSKCQTQSYLDSQTARQANEHLKSAPRDATREILLFAINR